MTYEAFSVNTPPAADPKAAPTGAPAAKVAKASDRDLPGGNESARIPNLINQVCQTYRLARMKEKLTEAGVVAAAPMPWNPLSMMRVKMSNENLTPRR
jgi:hypothetical protein